MAFTWMVVKNWTPPVASTAALAADFKLAASHIDQDFGVIADRDRNVVKGYSVMIEETQIDRLQQDYPGQFDGPFSDTQLAHTFSPTKL